MGNYPTGAEFDPCAPWNRIENDERDVEVDVTLTLHKTVIIKVDDYEVTDSGKDEDGEYYEDIDYSNCDLVSSVKEQVDMPKDWEIENLEVEIL